MACSLKLMTLLSRGDFFHANGIHCPDYFHANGNHSLDFFDANGENSPLERGAEPSEAGCVSRRSSKQHLENLTALPSKGESKQCCPKTAILSDPPLHHNVKRKSACLGVYKGTLTFYALPYSHASLKPNRDLLIRLDLDAFDVFHRS